MKPKPLKGVLNIPGDKSISHRALIFSTFLTGEVQIENCSPAVDCQSTKECLEALGLVAKSQNSTIFIQSKGISALHAPATQLFAGNSGTTIRLLSGLLAGQPFTSTLDGDASLRKRPMNRILKPLTEMGAKTNFKQESGCAPFTITGGKLKGQTFNLAIASAQVETALFLAGLQAEGETTVSLPFPVRDHTRRLFTYLDIPITYHNPLTASVEKLKRSPQGKTISVPGDPSSAAFFMVAASLIPDSDILLKNVGLNPGRTLALEVLQSMGASISYENECQFGFEPVADLRVKYNGQLKGTTISGADIARGIDEIPILALAGSVCQGQFIVSGAQELRHKESDRLKAITDNLKAAGAEMAVQEDGFIITGKPYLKGGSNWQTYHDHRLAMTGLIAQLVCQEELTIEEIESIKISYPEFQNHLSSLSG